MLTATILVVASLTALILILALIAFSSLLKHEKSDIEAGKKDAELLHAEVERKSKRHRVLNTIYGVFAALILGTLVSLATVSVVYRANNDQFTINNKVSLVIASDSMNGFYDDDYKVEVLSYKDNAEKQQFAVGDILTFEKVNEESEIIVGDVYGYKNNKGYIITHRCIGKTDEGKFIFRGDNTGGRDSYVNRSQIILHYTEAKINYVGLFILFSKSAFGLYALISVIVVYVIAEVFSSKYNKVVKARLYYLNNLPAETKQEEPVKEVEPIVEPVEEKPAEVMEVKATEPAIPQDVAPKPQREVLAEFTRANGKHVVIYAKKGGAKKHD